jgi:mevalonate kinase
VKNYPAKVILFGEYSLIHGSDALACPLTHFSGQWKFCQNRPVKQTRSELVQLFQYMKVISRSKNSFLLSFDEEAFEREIKEGIYFDSSIPEGNGLGSSGALCAAVFDRYFLHEHLSEKDKIRQLGLIENFFHTSSSGIDPFISLQTKTYLFHGMKEFTALEDFFSRKVENEKASLWLINTGLPRKTSPLVKFFLQKLEDEDINKKYLQEYLPLVNRTIKSFMSCNVGEFIETFISLSKFQLEILDEMFVSQLIPTIGVGLSNQDFYLKLCGAGGGGCYLGLETTPGSLKKHFSQYELIKLVSI